VHLCEIAHRFAHANEVTPYHGDACFAIFFRVKKIRQISVNPHFRRVDVWK
jgi:hypothetical protein